MVFIFQFAEAQAPAAAGAQRQNAPDYLNLKNISVIDKSKLEQIRQVYGNNPDFLYSKDAVVGSAKFDYIVANPAVLPSVYYTQRPLMNVGQDGGLNAPSMQWCIDFCATVPVIEKNSFSVAFQVPVERPGKKGEDVNRQVADGIRATSANYLSDERGVANPQVSTTNVYMTGKILASNLSYENCDDVLKALANDATGANYNYALSMAQKERVKDIASITDAGAKLDEAKKLISSLGDAKLFFEHHTKYPGLVSEYDKLRVAIVPYKYSLAINKDGFLEVSLQNEVNPEQKENVFAGIEGKRVAVDYGLYRVEGVFHYDKRVGRPVVVDHDGNEIHVADEKKLDAFGKNATVYQIDELGGEHFVLKVIRTDIKAPEAAKKKALIDDGMTLDAYFVTDKSLHALGFMADYQKEVPKQVGILSEMGGNKVIHSDISGAWKTNDKELADQLEKITENDPKNYEKFFSNMVAAINYYLDELERSRNEGTPKPKLPELLSHKNIVLLTDLACTDDVDFVKTGGIFAENTVKKYHEAIDRLRAEGGIDINLSILAVAPPGFYITFPSAKSLNTMDKFKQAEMLIGADHADMKDDKAIRSAQGEYGSIIWYYEPFGDERRAKRGQKKDDVAENKKKTDIGYIFNQEIRDLSVPAKK